ncbi:MAG: PEP-CTERM sorting domain-containing protein [Pirellulales bacterium]|nr:PEP-CTERM sorting domain-containing protein [Pirellulales bacterium]
MTARATRNSFRNKILTAGCISLFAGTALVNANSAILYSENFDSLGPLMPFNNPPNSGGTGSDWTDVPPAGWVRDNSGITPDLNHPDFFGFTFLNKDSWVATEGDQGRAQFTSGTGIVMVADGDAYDDASGTIEPNGFNAFITTQSIDLTNITANSVVLYFDSSFFPYDAMTATLEVSFDGGSNFSEILRYDTANSGGSSSFSRINENLALPIANPTGGQLQFRFGLTETGNDWFWAVDNIRVEGDIIPEPSMLVLGGLGLAAAGAVTWNRRRKQA